MRVCLGGTFSPFHKGHKLLLKKAVEVAGDTGVVFIGVTSDKCAKRKGSILSFQKRKKMIEQFLSKEKMQITIQPLLDKYGPSIAGDFDAIVVSPDTKSIAEEINEKRKILGKKSLQIVVIPFVLADDNRPISSTRIRNREINEEGLLL